MPVSGNTRGAARNIASGVSEQLTRSPEHEGAAEQQSNIDNTQQASSGSSESVVPSSSSSVSVPAAADGVSAGTPSGGSSAVIEPEVKHP